MSTSISSRFRIRERLGGGSFGEIYKGENVFTEEKVAIKLESKKSKSHLLFNESKVYKLLAGGVGIPNIKYYGTEEEHNALVMDLLGKSLEDLFNHCHKKFSLKTVLMIADQMLTRTEYLHNKNLIHRDIKPENFVVGKGNKSNQIFMIDMGLSKRYCDPISHEHNELIDGKSLIGTALYASINSHLGYEQSRRDDIEGIVYVLIKLLKGCLPWQGIKTEDRKEKNKQIAEMKLSMSSEEICSGLPCEFSKLLNSARSLHFADRPDYAGYRSMFRDLFIKEGFVYDYIFDWDNTYNCKPENDTLLLKENVYEQNKPLAKLIPTQHLVAARKTKCRANLARLSPSSYRRKVTIYH